MVLTGAYEGSPWDWAPIPTMWVKDTQAFLLHYLGWGATSLTSAPTPSQMVPSHLIPSTSLQKQGQWARVRGDPAPAKRGQMSPGGLGQKEPYAKHRVSLAPKQGTKNFQSLKPWSKGGKHGVKEEGMV